MIKRDRALGSLCELLVQYPVVAIIGARQVGKTTLARDLAAGHSGPTEFFDLENPEDVGRMEDPMVALRDLRGLVVIDEVQRSPGLFQILRVLADRPKRPATFLILGSASTELLRQSSESLAGRIAYHELGGFVLDEIGPENHAALWRRGGLPLSYLADTEKKSFGWRTNFVKTFLERDLPQLGIKVPSETMRRFWTMLAHYHGQVWNSAEFARAFGMADTTVRGYLDQLTAALVVRQLLPWHENLSKRQVKSPKIYVADSGLLHCLLNLPGQRDLDAHPKVGASWEGFVIGQVVRLLGAQPEECHFWATHSGAELDLLVIRGRSRLGFEIKRTSAPQVTPSMGIARQDLKLDGLTVIHAGEKSFPMGERIRAVPVSRLLSEIEPL